MHHNHRILNIGLIVAGALPALVALAVSWSMLSIAWPDLNAEQRAAFIKGLALTLLPGLATAVTGIWYLKRNRATPVAALIPLALLLIAGNYVYLRYVHVAITVADWIFDQGDFATVVFSAVIPVFYYVLFYAATHFQITSQRNLVANIIAAILLPVVAYVSFNVLRNFFATGLNADLQQMFLIALTTAFSFVMLRLLIHAASRHSARLSDPSVIWSLRLIFIGVLPLVGLLLNSYGPVARESQLVLGDFNHATFWLLAALNALFYLVPDFKFWLLQVLLVVARLAGFVFVLYFCVVFVLYVPLALLLIAAIGLGFLLLIPYFAAALQIMRLKEDLQSLRRDHGRSMQILVSVSGLALLPGIAYAGMLFDRLMFLNAVEYVQQPPIATSQQPLVSATTALKFTEKRAARRGRRQWDDTSVPIYDRLYRNVVLDGAELSDSLRQRLRHVFLGEKEAPLRTRTRFDKVHVDQIEVKKKKSSEAISESVLRIRIKNADASRNLEFDTTISLPDNAFVTEHWLTIDGVEVPAQITTRSLALWVFNRVTERLRDPSLIYYEQANLLRWKVFPVPAQGIREARLHLTHAGDATLMIGEKRVQLKGEPLKNAIAATDSDFVLLPAPKPSDLISRRPYLHFIADCSTAAGNTYPADAASAAKYLGLGFVGARVSFVNSGVSTVALDSPEKLHCTSRQHGFFLTMAFRALLHEQSALPGAPVFVVLSPQRPDADWSNLSYFLQYYGDSDAFVHMKAGQVSNYNFHGVERGEKPAIGLPVRRVANRHFAADRLMVNARVAGETSKLIDGAAYHHRFVLGDFAARRRAVVSAIETGTLNPATGSIVLETEAQRLKLSEMHKQMLSARNELDTGERARMSEPSAFLIALLLPLWYLRQKRRRKN